jgi:hypothetical protein
MSASGVKTLLTGDSFCEDDIIVSYTKPSAPTPVLQSKTVSPSTSQQTVSPDSGYDGLSQVTVNAMPSGSATTPATTITANPTISVNASGLITASVSKTQGVTPSVTAGYVSSGTSGTITVNGSNTNQLTTKSAQTYTPTTTDQTIASGQYLTGVQIIKGDANLLAENIKKDVVIFGITGTYEGDVPSGYTVTVSLTNPVNGSSFSSCYIRSTLSNDIYDNVDTIGSISSATGSTEVSVDSTLYGITVYINGASVLTDLSMCSCTGGVSAEDTDYAGAILFRVTGNGTITIDGVDYDN